MFRPIIRGSTYSLLILVFLLGACSEELSGPEPQMDSAPDELATDPSFACNEDPGSWITLSGEDFSPLVVDAIATEADHDVELPTVTLTLRADPTGEATEEGFSVVLESPRGAEAGQIRWLDAETLQFLVSDDLELPPGVYDVQVTNPNGESVIETEAFGVLPRPKLDEAIPEMTCVAQGERNVVLHGEDFLILDDEYPTIEVGGESFDIVAVADCHDLHAVFGGHQLCAEATARIDEDSLEPGTYPVTLENLEPAACPSIPEDDGVNLTIVPPPTVDDIQPSPICAEQLDYESVEITGEGFIVLDGDGYPDVHIGPDTFQPESADGCESIDEAPSMNAQSCTSLTVSIPAGAFAGLVSDDELITDVAVVVENPDPVGCHSEEEIDLGIVPPPTVSAVAPRAFCTSAESVLIDVEGDHFFEVDGEMPTLSIGDSVYDTVGVDCADVDGQEGLRNCQVLEAEIDPADLDGLTTLTVTNPEPMACESADSEEFYAVPEVLISQADPSGFCEDETFDGDLTLYGPFVYDTAGDLPVVTVDGTVVAIDELFGCEPVIDGLTIESCEGIQITVPESLIDDEFDVTVTTSDPLACGEDTVVLERTTPPTIDAVVPGRVCADGGTTLEVLGSNIHQDAEFTLDGQAATSATVAADGSSATVTFGASISGDFATFEVINPGDCGSEYSEELRITDGPLPVFVDPPVVYDDMNTQVTIYAAGLYGGTVDEVELILPDGSTIVLVHSYDDSRPAVIQATIPAGTLGSVDPADLNDDGTADFGIRLTDQEITCSNEADDLVTITGELTLALEDIDPPFGAQDQSTGVTITAVDEANLEPDEVQLEATPRAYLNPVGGGGSDLAREIQAIQFIDGTEMNGIVPSGLPVGFYDVIVVNPNGEVGVLDGAFQVTEERPPLIDGVSPGSWTTNNPDLAVEIEGQNFRDQPDDPTVEVFCQPSGSDETDENLLNQPASIDVVSVADDLVQIVVNTDGLEHLDACYMRLTNADGTFDEYSPITVTNPAGNFVEFQAGTAFDTARRGPTMFSGVPSRAARYLYVVGGDDGALTGLHSSGEFARVNRFGAPQTWHYLPYDLPSGRTLANGVRIDDFVYLVGGHDGAGVSDEVLRAQVLDPLDSPTIVDLELDLEQFTGRPDSPGEENGDNGDNSDDGDNGSGLDAGTYYYRVSAVYTSDDPANPMGESLASEPQPVSLPVDGVELTISWIPPEYINHDISHYRVYRNLQPDDPYGDEALIYETADASETSFTDDGSLTPIAGTNPLPTGSLGMWHQVATLNFPRMVAGITVAPNPEDSSEYFIYAIGGEDDAGDFRADYEFVSVDVNGPRAQDVFDAVIGQDGEGEDMLLPAPRGEHQAVTAHEGNANSLVGEAPHVFTLAGQTQGAGDTTNYVATVGPDGHLSDWTAVTAIIGGTKAGHAGAAINNNVATAGGQGGQPSTQAFHTDITCGATCPPPGLSNWTSLSNVNMEPRVWMGSVTFRGFWYLAGGLTDGDVPSNTVDYSVAGGAP